MENNKLSKEWKSLVETMKKANWGREIAIPVGLLCKKEEHAIEMKKYIEKNPNKTFDDYLDKAYEIIGETRPTYTIED
jgi:hypothetical protein